MTLYTTDLHNIIIPNNIFIVKIEFLWTMIRTQVGTQCVTTHNSHKIKNKNNISNQSKEKKINIGTYCNYIITIHTIPNTVRLCLSV